MNAAKMTTVEEIEVGTEDRVFLCDDGRWYFQIRGTPNAIGPFSSKDDAIDAYSENRRA